MPYGHAAALVKVAQNTGMSEHAATQCTARLLGIPPSVATQINNTADLAAVLVSIYKGHLDGLPGAKGTNVQALSPRRLRKHCGECTATSTRFRTST